MKDEGQDERVHPPACPIVHWPPTLPTLIPIRVQVDDGKIFCSRVDPSLYTFEGLKRKLEELKFDIPDAKFTYKDDEGDEITVRHIFRNECYPFRLPLKTSSGQPFSL